MKQKYKIISKITAIQLIMILILMTLFTLLLPNNSQAVTYYNQSVKSGIKSFPVEYHNILENIKKIYPNATFEAYYTGISWEDLIAGETSVHTRNTVINSSDSSWKCSCGKVVSGYACASKEIIKYYIDPRNFLNEVNIFQFLEISYNSNIHKLEGVQSAVKNTFLDSNVTFTRNGKVQTMSYAQIILEAAKESNMSPYSIITKIIQEVGTNGSNSVSGTYPKYEGYYNFFNYGAYDSGNAILNALIYAKDNGWNNQYDAIIEGSKLLSNSYTMQGQNTAYFYKWDVVGTSILKAGNSQTVSSSNLFAHQYMTNIQDPTNQSKRLYNTYAKNGLLDKPLNFIIPIFEDQSNISNKLPNGIDSSNPNAYYVNEPDGINVRSEPSIFGNKIASIKKDTVVLIITRNYKTSDGYSWDKVQLANGVVGYVASEYLSPCNGKEVNNQTNEKVIGQCITTDNLRLRENASSLAVTLEIIPKGTKIDLLVKDVANDGTNKWYKVKYAGKVGYVSSLYLKEINENINTNTNTNTNANTNNTTNNNINNTKNNKYKISEKTIQIVPKTTIDEIKKQYPNTTGEIKTGANITIEGVKYTAIIKGDTNGDGNINSSDLLKIVKHLNETAVFSNEFYKKAADVNGDGNINSADLLTIVKYLKGTTSITI